MGLKTKIMEIHKITFFKKNFYNNYIDTNSPKFNGLKSKLIFFRKYILYYQSSQNTIS